MKSWILIILIYTILLLGLAAIIKLLGVPLTFVPTLIVAIGTIIAALAALLNIIETRKLESMGVQPIIRIAAISLFPEIPTTPVETNGGYLVYLENIGNGTAKNVKLELIELIPKDQSMPPSDLVSLYFNGEPVFNQQKPAIRNIDFLPPVRALETSVSLTREPFRAKLIFSPFENRYHEFNIKDEGHVRFFHLKIKCLDLRNEIVSPVSYFLVGSPAKENSVIKDNKWLEWEIYPEDIQRTGQEKVVSH